MEHVSQEVVQEEGRNQFKMGLGPFQDVWHWVGYKAPLKPSSLKRGTEIKEGPLISLFEGIQRVFDVLGIGKAAMTDQEMKPVYRDNVELLQPVGGDIACLCQPVGIWWVSFF